MIYKTAPRKARKEFTNRFSPLVFFMCVCRTKVRLFSFFDKQFKCCYLLFWKVYLSLRFNGRVLFQMWSCLNCGFAICSALC